MAIVKNPSDGLNDTPVRPVSAASRPPQSASAWARTDEGRDAFARGFKVKVMDDKIIDANGEPMSYLVSSHSPSREWLQAMKVELEKEPILDIPIRAGLRAEYHARIIQQLSQPKSKPGTPQYALDKADAKRQSRYDARLNEHFHDLEDICIEVRRLRGQHPSAPEELWAVALNRLVAAAASRWVEFLDQPFNGTLAMPRSFSPTPPRDRIGLPRTFKPRKGLYLKRKVEGFNTLTARQKRCLNPTKSVRRLVNEATFPVFAGEWKASRDDIEQAHGQAMYSIVQAAGIFCNAQSNQRILTLAAGFGWAWPTSGSWAGEKSDHDVAIVQGKAMDLGTLKGAIDCFLMIYNAVETQVVAAFKETAEELHEHDLWVGPNFFFPVDVTPGSLVDWRARKMAKKGKGKPTDPPKNVEMEGKLENEIEMENVEGEGRVNDENGADNCDEEMDDPKDEDYCMIPHSIK